MMNEIEKYKQYYSQIKLDEDTEQRIRNDIHSVKRKKNSPFYIHTFNRYAALLSCLLVMVFALDSIVGREYTLPVYRVETTTQETSVDETDTEIITNNETTEYDNGNDYEEDVTAVPDVDTSSEYVTVVPDIDDDNEEYIETEHEDNTSPYKETQHTTNKTSGTRPPKNTGTTTKPSSPTTKPTETVKTSPITTSGTSISSYPTTTTPIETSSVISDIQTTTTYIAITETSIPYITVTEEGVEASETIRTELETTQAHVTTVYEEIEESVDTDATGQNYIINVMVEVDANKDLSKVINNKTFIGISDYYVIDWEIISSYGNKYVVKYVLKLSNQTWENTNSAVLWINNNPINGQVYVYLSRN